MEKATGKFKERRYRDGMGAYREEVRLRRKERELY